MKNILIIISIFIFSIASINACNLGINLINQDPYPAIPGGNVKILFQVTGVENSECREISFQINEKFPFEVDPGTTNKRTIQGGIFARDYSNFWIVPYNLRIDDYALGKTTKLEIKISNSKTNSKIIKEFDIEIKDVETDFEIYVRDYSRTKETITFEIINIGKSDVDALSIEIPTQENIRVKGTNRNTLGILDSNEYTTTTFNGIAESGKIKLKIRYNDEVGIRRIKEKEIEFDSSPFLNNNGKKSNWASILITLIIISGIVYFIYKKYKLKKKSS